MAKEIAEQPQAVADTLAGRLLDGCVQLEPSLTISERQVTIIGCGTSYHAGLLAQPMLRRCLGRPVDVAIASEWRYDDRPLDSADLVVGMTQSGETADTLAAMRRAQIAGGRVIAVTNVAESQAAREASATMLTRAQLEIGVAATKTFVAQVSALWLLALANAPTTPANRQLVTELTQLPQALADILAAAEAPMAELAERWAGQAFILFLGRRDGLPAAQEGALKLKEIAYVAADAYPAGEMKHGPIALLGPGTPVVGIATESNVFGKMVSNLAEARARGAETLAITSASAPELDDVADFQLRLPPAASWLQPVLAVIPLQLLAYHIATLRGLNVDQPRNLAKTVTVE
jgi:glucosamine--fructose-6-phosphate aminotransferase (isomerizing)